MFVHPPDCAGDCCAFDALTDALACGEDDSSLVEVPSGRGLRRYRHLFKSVGAPTLPAPASPQDPAGSH